MGIKKLRHIRTANEIISNIFFTQLWVRYLEGTRSVNQLIGQAEIDVMGVNIEKNEGHIYAIDIAFHEAGLNYGSKDETVSRVIKKCIRKAMCVYGYFDVDYGTIISTSPKINPSVEHDLLNCLNDINQILNEAGLNFKIRIIGNSDFAEKILEPMLNVLGDVADTSELFMRSLQMYNLFAEKKKSITTLERKSTVRRITPNLETINSSGLEGLDEMKIGVVRTV